MPSGPRPGSCRKWRDRFRFETAVEGCTSGFEVRKRPLVGPSASRKRQRVSTPMRIAPRANGLKCTWEGTTEPERCSWVGRACWIFFRKSFVLRSLRALYRPAPRSLRGWRKNLRRNHFPPNCIAPAKVRRSRTKLGHPPTKLGRLRTKLGCPRTQLGRLRTKLGCPRTQVERSRTQVGRPRSQLGRVGINLSWAEVFLGEPWARFLGARGFRGRVGVNVGAPGWPLPGRFNLKKAVEEGSEARKRPSHQGNEVLWDPSETSTRE